MSILTTPVPSGPGGHRWPGRDRQPPSQAGFSCPPIHHQRMTGDVTGVVTGKENHGLPDIPFAIADPAQGNLADHFGVLQERVDVGAVFLARLRVDRLHCRAEGGQIGLVVDLRALGCHFLELVGVVAGDHLAAELGRHLCRLAHRLLVDR